MPQQKSQSNSGSHSGRMRPTMVNQASNRVVLPMDRRKYISENDLEETLSSALLAGDKELGHILHEVDTIAKDLKLDAPDARAFQVAGHPAVWSAVRQALLDRELRYLALTDDLTCLYNRRGFFAAATQQLKLARRNAYSMLLFFCDVDNLKKINDSYGHREGDFALVRTADALEAAFRDSDVLARLGGDEFAILALQASHQDQEGVLRRLEKNLKKSNSNESRYELSLSVGVARFDPRHPIPLAELMAEADQAMYEQKRNHRQLA